MGVTIRSVFTVITPLSARASQTRAHHRVIATASTRTTTPGSDQVKPSQDVLRRAARRQSPRLAL
jgi:hypothetical protein